MEKKLIVVKEERVSKNGEIYEVLIIKYGRYEKMCFMNAAEKIIFEDAPLSKKV